MNSKAASTSSRPTNVTIGAFVAAILGFVASIVHPGFAVAAGPASVGAGSSAALLLGVAWKYLQTHFGWVQVEATKVASEVETDLPHIKEVVAAVEPVLDQIPGFQKELAVVKADAANAKGALDRATEALNIATDGVSDAVLSQVDGKVEDALRKFLPTLFPQPAPAAPAA